MYSRAYHQACTYLIHHSPFEITSPHNTSARRLIAAALRDIRCTSGRESAKRERYRLVMIGGMFPVKQVDI